MPSKAYNNDVVRVATARLKTIIEKEHYSKPSQREGELTQNKKPGSNDAIVKDAKAELKKYLSIIRGEVNSTDMAKATMNLSIRFT